MDRLIAALIAVIVLLLAGMALLMTGVLRMPQTPVSAPIVTPTKAPETQPKETALFQVYDGMLHRQDGSTIALGEQRGKPTLLVFWSSWCPDCKDYMINGLSEAFAQARALGAEAYLVCREGRRGESWDTAIQALNEMALSEPTLMDMDAALYDAMGLRWVPTAVLLDASGRMMAATTQMPDAQEMRALLQTVTVGHQAQTEAFLRENLLDSTGAIASTYSAAGESVHRGGTVLSETQGLMMLYAVRAKDQQLFDRLLDTVRNRMTVNGLTAWRSSEGERADVNAALDDLRILEALTLAEEAWGGYQQELSYRASALYRRCVKDGLLRDYAPLDKGDPADKVTLCYLDIAAMEAAASTYGKWNAAADSARTILEGGVISAEFPLYYPSYDPASGRYTGESLHMSEALVTVLNAARAGMDISPALTWLKTQLENGGIYARYDLRGCPVSGYLYESTAIYALLAQAAQTAGDTELARMALARMERNRCYTAPLVGDMGSIHDTEHNAFDLIQALLAWQTWNNIP